VYPGFLQLGAFVAMNWQTHVDRQLDLFHDLIVGDTAKADATKAFYDEYCAVLDLPAEFYLETVDRVFQRFLLPRGELEVRGRRVHPGAIRRTGLLTVEGGRDDICGVGQTMAAQEICAGVPQARRRHHLQAGVGHYGVFSGSAWERQISPVVRNFVLANE
jgi:polyhydroxyalkanoate depolymerase